jgi:hypothetical protein
MRDRFLRGLLLVVLALVLVVLARPYIDQALFAAKEPRAIEARGNLADIERLNIEIFQRASPSVVQIASRVAGGMARLGSQQRSDRAAASYGTAPATWSPTTTWSKTRRTSRCACLRVR